jgi:xanthine dehydrogenase accessory factor
VAATTTGWLDGAIARLERGKACALVTVIATEGSTPRECGSKMLVHDAGIEDSIGGGNLEFKAIERARSLLASPSSRIELSQFALGPSLGQCCGGHVRLMIERLDESSLGWLRSFAAEPRGMVLATDLARGVKTIVGLGEAAANPVLTDDVRRFLDEGMPLRLIDGPDGQPRHVLERMRAPVQELNLFGAGHVGGALIRILGTLPYRIRWFDARAEMFPHDLPANVGIEISADPRRDVAVASAGALFLVMTHSHALDFDICDQVLRRGDFAFLGLIGSASKRTTFLRRLRLRGHSEAAIARITCPIGLPAIAGKSPAAVAVSVAGQLLSLPRATSQAGTLRSRRKA